MPLSSLSAWSIQQTRAVFEAPTSQLCQRAIESTFSPTLTARLNGTPLTYAALCRLVHAMRASAPRGLVVEWTRAEASPNDCSNRVGEVFAAAAAFMQLQSGTLVGEYTVRGIWKDGVEVERHKKVEVRCVKVCFGVELVSTCVQHRVGG